MKIPLKDQDFAKTKFIDTLDYKDLAYFTTMGKISLGDLSSGQNIFIQSKLEPFIRFVQVIQITEYEIRLLDRIEFFRNINSLNETDHKHSKSLAIYNINLNDIEAMGKLEKINHTDLLKQFKKFNKELQTILKERFEYLKNNPQMFYYEVLNNKNQLSDDQLKNRESLSILNKSNSYEFKEKWNSGYYHLKTFTTRANQTSLNIGKDLSKVLGHEKDEDYGLTDTEIISGLQNAHMFLELYLYKAFVSGEKHLPKMISLYSKYKSNPNLKILFRNVILNNISEEELSFLESQNDF